MPVYDPHAHASPNQLIREHQPGGASADDEYVSVQAPKVRATRTPAQDRWLSARGHWRSGPRGAHYTSVDSRPDRVRGVAPAQSGTADRVTSGSGQRA